MQAVVLLATYNGAPYLPAQLDSILAQTCPPRWIIVRDDGSRDSTLDVLDRYRKRYPKQLLLLPNLSPGLSLGPLRQFSVLTEYVLAEQRALGLNNDYAIAFSDQDDVWDPQRLALGLQRLAQLRRRYGNNAPLLIHSELSVIDAHGQQLHPRFSDYQGLTPHRNGFSALLLQNVVSGCSALITPALARNAVPIPSAAAMHDWWIALIAALCGHIEFIDRPLIAYRQHGRNFFGAREKQALPLKDKAASLLSADYDATVRPVIAQARYLLSHSPLPLRYRQRLGCYLILALGYRNVWVRLGALRTLRLLAAVSP